MTFFTNKWVRWAFALFSLIVVLFFSFGERDDGVLLVNKNKATIFVVLGKADSAEMETAFIRADWIRANTRTRKVVENAPPAYRVGRLPTDSFCRGGYVLERLPGEDGTHAEMFSGCFFSPEEVVRAVEGFERT